MAYNTYINDKQIFGDNDYFPEWIEFIKSQNIDIDKEDGFYKGEITDLQKMFECLDKIVRNNLDNFFREKRNDESTLDYMYYLTHHSAYSYIWLVWEAIQDVVETDQKNWREVVDKNGIVWWREAFNKKIKNGCKIIVSAG